MKSILDLFPIQWLQEFIVESIYYSLILGFVMGILIWFLEKNEKRINKTGLYHIYKVSLFAMFIGPVLTSLLFSNTGRMASGVMKSITIPEDWNYWICFIWGMGVCFYLLIVISAEIYLKRIIQSSSDNFSIDWIKLIVQAQKKANYVKNVTIVHTHKVSSAFVSGVIKPVLVIPTSWVNQISHEDAELILLHELSHLKVKDHYINVICTISEILYFFNPFIHLLVKRIRFQRELCVDQMVVDRIKQPVRYASFLIHLGECNMLTRSIHFGSIKNQLSIRVKSILNLQSNGSERIKSISYSLLATMGLIILMQTTQVPLRNDIGSLELACEAKNPVNPEQAKNVPQLCKPTNEVIPKRPSNKPSRTERSIVIKTNSTEDPHRFDESNNEFENAITKNLINIEESKSIASAQDLTKADSGAVILVLSNQAHSYYSTGQRLYIVNNRYYFEKDWKYKIQQDKKVYRYIILNEGTKTILSYNGNIQVSNLNSSVN